MGMEITQAYPPAGDIFRRASEVLGYDMEKLIFLDPQRKLGITEYTQPAILTASWAMAQPLIGEGFRSDFVAGLSLGEYTAHVYAESIRFEDAVVLVQKRGRFMQEEAKPGSGGMMAVMGLDEETVEQALGEIRPAGYIACANYNSPGQVVLSGETAALEYARGILVEKGAKRVIPLDVSAPFHCELLRNAGVRLEKELNQVTFRTMRARVVSNVTADVIEREQDIRDLLVAQVTSPVRWTQSILKMASLGADTYVEIGPGKILAGLVRKILPEARICNVEDAATLEITTKELRKLGYGI